MTLTNGLKTGLRAGDSLSERAGRGNGWVNAGGKPSFAVAFGPWTASRAYSSEMSRASASLNRKLGMVDVEAYAWGSLSHAKIHSRVVFEARYRSEGGRSVAVITRPSGEVTLWQLTQP